MGVFFRNGNFPTKRKIAIKGKAIHRALSKLIKLYLIFYKSYVFI